MNQAQEQLEAQRKHNEAYHLTLPSVDQIPSVLNPSGLVPYPCDHGMATKPAEYGDTKFFNAQHDEHGNERPPFGGRSWGRSKYLLYLEPVIIEGKHVQFRPKCVVCLGQPRPDDLTTPREQA